MTVSRGTLAVVACAALVTSYWTVYHFIAGVGGDLVHAWLTPLCLELAALGAAHRYHRTRDGVALTLFWLPFSAALAINFAHGLPSLVLAAIYVIPPIAAVGVGDLYLREARGDVDQDDDVAVHGDVPVGSNGHGPTIVEERDETPRDRIAAAIPDSAAFDRWRDRLGGVNAVADHFGVTRHQLNAWRKEIGNLR